MDTMTSTPSRTPSKGRRSRTRNSAALAFGQTTWAASWSAELPSDWHQAVVSPLDVKVHRDYEADAIRVLGRDEDGALCYSAHRYSLREPRSDDGEDFFLAPVYGEALRAWRLRDGRWLIHRVVAVGEELETARGFYSFSETAPR